jgi:hypothetical protein
MYLLSRHARMFLLGIHLGAKRWMPAKNGRSAIITAVLFLLLAFVSYMRWEVKPISPREPLSNKHRLHPLTSKEL